MTLTVPPATSPIVRSVVLVGTADETAMRCYVAEPVVSGRGPVVVLPELFGLSPHVLAVCDGLAAEGFRAVSPDLYHRTPGRTVLPEDDGGRETGFGLLAGVTREWLVEDTRAAVALASAGGPAGCALLGLSVGGHLGLLAAASMPLPRVALLYPGWLTSTTPPVPARRPALEDIDRVEGRLLVVVGSEDGLVDDREREAIGVALAARGERLVVPEGVGHGFLCPGRASYDAAAAADAWRLVVAHLTAP